MKSWLMIWAGITAAKSIKQNYKAKKMTTDTLKELTAKAKATPGSIRDKEQAFCDYVTSAITRHHGQDGLKKVWFRTEHGSIGDLAETPLEKWYELLNEARVAFWQQVEAGAIEGYLPGGSLPIESW
jgi:hypothetical protein